MTQFLATTLNGLTLAALYFIVASGFTLVFGLMRNVNLAHGSLYLLGGYIGFEVTRWTGSWYFGLIGGFLALAVIGAVLQLVLFRHMEGQELRQTLVTIALSIILADGMLWIWGGGSYQFEIPQLLLGATPTPLPGLPFYSTLRLATLALAIVIGVALWLFLTQTRLGAMIRAGVDDRSMLDASGVNVHLIFALTFALGAGLAGIAGVVGGTVLSLAPAQDTQFLLASLVVVIVGGMGSVAGSALGALLIGLAEQYGLTYTPTYGVLYTFIIFVVVLAVRPQGLLGRSSR